MSSVESFTGGQEFAVDFSKIERELTALWKAAADSSKEDDSPAVTHACILNLVVHCSGTEEGSRVEETIATVARARPSRVLLAVVDLTSRAEGLQASLSAHCTFTPGAGKGKQVCCEQITLKASGESVQHLPGAVLPLLLPDLPVILWYPGDPDLTSPTARRLIDSADLLVVDSRRMIDVVRQFRGLACTATPVSDLGWQRLRGWREVTAGIFDDANCEKQSSLVDAITVDYSSPSGSSGELGPHCAEAMVLGTWVADRLGWKPSTRATERSKGRRGFSLSRPGRKEGTMTLVARSGEEGGILGLTLKAGKASFNVKHGDSSDTLSVTVTMPASCPVPRTVRVVERDEATLLCRALEDGGGDAVFHRTLDLASRLLGRGEQGGN